MTPKLRSILVQAGLMQSNDVRPLGELLRKKVLQDESFLRAVHTASTLSLVEIAVRDEKLLTRADREFFQQKLILPLREEAGSVIAAVVDPWDFDAQKALAFVLNKPVIPVFARPSELEAALYDEWTTVLDEEDVSVVEVMSLVEDEISEGQDANTPPVVRLVNRMLSEAVHKRASDIHLEPSEQGLSVRVRVDGEMVELLSVPRRLQQSVIARIKVLSMMDIAEKRRPQDGRFRIGVRGIKIDLRVATAPTIHGESIVARLLRSEQAIPTLEALGPTTPVETFRRFITKTGKLIVVTGPTGSGKTTTLYALLRELRDKKLSIHTIENPIEYRLQGVNQLQVNEGQGFSFASALKSLMRHDPDVLMVGDIRDAETAEVALHAAQTGHLVLSTMHTNDAPSALVRLVQLGIPPFVVASAVGAVIAQRLVRHICPSCNGSGCPGCEQKGARGRIALFSVLPITDRVAQVVAEGCQPQPLIEAARAAGMLTIGEAGEDLVRRGLTSLSEIEPYLDSHELVSQPENTNQIQRQTVLVVDDDPDIRSVLSLVLSRECYTVIEAENGREALHKLHLHTPNVILCDLMMPEMNGRELLARLRSNSRTSQIPVVMLTAAESDEKEIELLDSGACDFVRKSSSSDVLLSRLRRALA